MKSPEVVDFVIRDPYGVEGLKVRTRVGLSTLLRLLGYQESPDSEQNHTVVVEKGEDVS